MKKEIILQYVGQITDPGEVDELMDVIFQRKRELYPGWEILYVAIPKNDQAERKRTLEWLMGTI